MTFASRYAFILTTWCCLYSTHSSLLAADPTVAELVQAAKSGAEPARLKAIDQLAAQGPKAAAAEPALTQLLSDGSANIRAHAAYALGKLGDAAKPAATALASLIKDSDETVRRQAVQALGNIRPGPQVMIPLVTRLIEDSDPVVRVRILHAVAEAGPAAVDALTKALKEEKAAYWACLILREIGPEAKAAVPALIVALADPRPEIRREAALALGAMQAEAASAATDLAKLLDDEQAAVAATLALGEIGQIPASAEPKVRANAKGSQKVLSTISMWTLARVHPEEKSLGREAAEQLVARLSDQDPFVRVSAARALAALNLGPEIMLPIMEKALAGADETTAHHALDAIATLREKAVPRLIDALKHEKLRAQIAYTLGQIGPPAAPATDALASLLASKDSRVVTEAAMALAKIGPTASKSAPALAAALKREECPNPHAILYAIGKMGPEAIAAKPEVLSSVGSKDQSIAVVAAGTLTLIDPRSADTPAKVLPVLIAGLSNPIPETRQMAVETLAGLKAAAKDALPALEKASKDENLSVREAAVEALAAVRGSQAGAKK